MTNKAALTPADLGQAGEGVAEWISLRDTFLKGVQALEPVQPLLGHVARAIELFSSKSKVTISRIFPVAWSLYEHAARLSKDNSIATREFATCFRDDLDQRFFYEATPTLIQCAEALDPSTVFHDRLGHGRSREGEGDLRLLRDAVAAEMFSTKSKSAGTSSAELDYFGEAQTSATEETANQTRFKSEFGLYLKEVQKSPHIDDGLKWWREHSASYPVVAFVVRCFLAAQASSAETERLFSTAAHVVNKLTGKRAAHLITLSKALRESKRDKDEDSTEQVVAEVVEDFE